LLIYGRDFNGLGGRAAFETAIRNTETLILLACERVPKLSLYNAREKSRDERTGEVKDYSRKDGILFSGIFAPKDVPEWTHFIAPLIRCLFSSGRSTCSLYVRPIDLQLQPCRWKLYFVTHGDHPALPNVQPSCSRASDTG